MKKALAVVSLLTLVLGAGIAVADVKDETATLPEGGNAAPGNCPLEGYKNATWTGAVAVPDNNATGVTLPSLTVPADGSTIQDVVIDFKMGHSWVGDLRIELTYQPSCGAVAVGPALLVCRPNSNNAACPRSSGTSTFGCSANLHTSNTYYWGEGGGGFMGITPDCPTSSTLNVPAGCYKPQGSGLGTGLDIFRGLPKGGCWILKVSDNAGGDTGTITMWSVHLLNQPTATEESSWGNVKGLFR